MVVICPHPDCGNIQEQKTPTCTKCGRQVKRRDWDHPQTTSVKKVCSNSHITWLNQDDHITVCGQCGASLETVKYSINVN